MKPIYKYVFDATLKTITVTTITDYEERETNAHLGTAKKYYRYKGKGGLMYIYARDIDVFKSGRVYSFSDDLEKARAIMLDEATKRRHKAGNEFNKWNNVVDILQRGL